MATSYGERFPGDWLEAWQHPQPPQVGMSNSRASRTSSISDLATDLRSCLSVGELGPMSSSSITSASAGSGRNSDSGSPFAGGSCTPASLLEALPGYPTNSLLQKLPPSLHDGCQPSRMAAAPAVTQARDPAATGPAGAAAGSCGAIHPPPPSLLLAALSATLSAQKHQDGAHVHVHASQADVPVALHALSAHTCSTCNLVFGDAAAYHTHCASLDHVFAVLHHSLALNGTTRTDASAGTLQPAQPLQNLQPSALLNPCSLPGATCTNIGAAAAAAEAVAACSLKQPTGPAILQQQQQQHHHHHHQQQQCHGLTNTLAGGTLGLRCNSTGILADTGSQPVPAAAKPLYAGSFLDAVSPSMTAAALHRAPLQQQHALPAVNGPSMPTCAITSCCNQLLDPELDTLCHALLRQLRQLDGVERAMGLHAAHGKAARRLQGGMREVRKAVKTGAAVAVVVAVDIQEVNSCGRCSAQPGAEIGEICRMAELVDVPVVFALSRLTLGSLFGVNKRMSAVAVTNASGLEAPLQQVLRLAAVCRARFAALVHAGPAACLP